MLGQALARCNVVHVACLSQVNLSIMVAITFHRQVLIGCDGVHSVVAHWLGLKAPIDSGRIGVRGLAVYPEGHGLKHQVQQFVDEGLRAGVVPLNGTEIYWFIAYKSCVKGLLSHSLSFH